MDNLTITIDLGNAAFHEAPLIDEIRQVLEQVIYGLGTAPCGPNGIRKNLLDSNGNTCGYWSIT